jgi:hypothetical protein
VKFCPAKPLQVRTSAAALLAVLFPAMPIHLPVAALLIWNTAVGLMVK